MTECEIHNDVLRNIRCIGCPVFAASLSCTRDMVINTDLYTNETTSVIDCHGRCTHTILLEDVWRVHKRQHDPFNRFESFVNSELLNSHSVCLLQMYGDTMKWLVVLPEGRADETGSDQFAVCRTTSADKYVSIYCHSTKCGRGKNKRFHIRKTRSIEVCAHLYQILNSQECCELIGCEFIGRKYPLVLLCFVVLFLSLSMCLYFLSPSIFLSHKITLFVSTIISI